MNLPTALLTIRWMIRDTIRQSLASKLFWIVLGVSVICIAVCLSIRVEGDQRLPTRPGEDKMSLPDTDPSVKDKGIEQIREEGIDVLKAKLTIGFGLFTIDLKKDRTDAVRLVQIFMSGIIADTAGILLILIWTAGFLPQFLDPNQATVMLAKPVPRWSLLLGKFIGVICFVLLQATIFVLGTWLALGLSTGVYDPLYLLTIPLLAIHFGIFYSFSVMLAVWTRSTVVCVFGTLVFWMICWGMNFGRHAMVANEVGGLSGGGHTMMNVGYWILPKPGDMNLMLFDALQADNFSVKVPEFKKLQDDNRFHPELSMLASLAFAAAMLAIAVRELELMDY